MSEMGGDGDGEIPAAEATSPEAPAGGDGPVIDDAQATAANDNLGPVANDNAERSPASDRDDALEPAGAVGLVETAEPANDNTVLRADEEAGRMQSAEWTDDKYGNLDNWERTVLPAGTIVYAGYPSATGFCVPGHVVDEVGDDARALSRGLQIAPYRDPYADTSGDAGARDPRYRPEMRAYRLLEDTEIGVSKAEANTQWGHGGLEQYYIPNFEHATEPVDGVGWEMVNMDSVHLATDDDE